MWSGRSNAAAGVSVSVVQRETADAIPPGRTKCCSGRESVHQHKHYHLLAAVPWKTAAMGALRTCPPRATRAVKDTLSV